MERYPDEVALLVAQTGPLDGQRWALRDTVLIGRDASCDIVVADRQVSRHHARLTILPDGIILEDLQSKNGTHHNGIALTGKTTLQDGDTVQIALAQKFVFLSSDATVPLDNQETSVQAPADAPVHKPQTLCRLTLERRSRRVWIYLHTREKKLQRQEISPPLSVSQFLLLETLYKNQGRVVPRRELITAVWGEEQAYEVSEQALDALVRRLRSRIASVDPTHTYVVTVRGHGLRLDNPEIPD